MAGVNLARRLYVISEGAVWWAPQGSSLCPGRPPARHCPRCPLGRTRGFRLSWPRPRSTWGRALHRHADSKAPVLAPFLRCWRMCVSDPCRPWQPALGLIFNGRKGSQQQQEKDRSILNYKLCRSEKIAHYFVRKTDLNFFRKFQKHTKITSRVFPVNSLRYIRDNLFF